MTQTMAQDASPLDTVRDVVGKAAVDRVFGAPISVDDLTVIPVAKVAGGGGGGGGNSPAGEDSTASGSGGGVGLAAKAVGVFTVKGETVRWRPAIDLNKIVLGGQIVVVVALLTIRAIVKARARTQ